MTRNPVTFARTKHTHHVVRHTDGHIQQFPFARSLIVSDSSFRHVTGTIHLMLVHIRPTLVHIRQGVERIDITIRLLGCRKLINPFIRLFLQFGIRMVDQTIGHTFQSFIHIGVIEEDTRVFPFALCGILEVPDTTCLVLDLIDTHRQRSGNMLFQTRRPESILNLHMREIDRIDHFQRSLLLRLFR